MVPYTWGSSIRANTIETTKVTLPTAYQIATADDQTFNQSGLSLTNSWLVTTNYWTQTSSSLYTNIVWCVVGEGVSLGNNQAHYSSGYGARPVITTLKTNLKAQ